MLKPIPEFQSEDEEGEFWATRDSTEYVNWSRAERCCFSEAQAGNQNDFIEDVRVDAQ